MRKTRKNIAVMVMAAALSCGAMTMTANAGWQQNATGWWFENDDHSYISSSWAKINGQWYLFNSSGYMLTGWQNVNGTWYYMNGSGAMLTGWQNIGGTWYYMNGSGAMLTGWQNIGGTWYYMNGSGAMLTGWQDINGSWYYLDGSGAMVTGQRNINGTNYSFDSSGRWQEQKKAPTNASKKEIYDMLCNYVTRWNDDRGDYVIFESEFEDRGNTVSATVRYTGNPNAANVLVGFAKINKKTLTGFMDWDWGGPIEPIDLLNPDDVEKIPSGTDLRKYIGTDAAALCNCIRPKGDIEDSYYFDKQLHLEIPISTEGNASSFVEIICTLDTFEIVNIGIGNIYGYEETPYNIYGVYTGMPYEEAKKTLKKNGCNELDYYYFCSDDSLGNIYVTPDGNLIFLNFEDCNGWFTMHRNDTGVYPDPELVYNIELIDRENSLHYSHYKYENLKKMIID